MSFNFKFEFQTIKAKFTAVTMCIVTLVTISLTIISSIFISKSSYDSMYSLMKPLSGQISQNVMTVIKEQKNICDTIAKDESVTEGYVFSADPVMKSPIDDGDALAYSIFNADGSVWLHQAIHWLISQKIQHSQKQLPVNKLFLFHINPVIIYISILLRLY